MVIVRSQFTRPGARVLPRVGVGQLVNARWSVPADRIRAYERRDSCRRPESPLVGDPADFAALFTQREIDG